MPLVLALLLAQGFHAGISAGLGTAYDGIGVRLEAGGDHFGAFGSIGKLGVFGQSSITADTGASFSAGLRWYLEARRGLFISLNLGRAWWSNWREYKGAPGNPTRPAALVTATAVAGYRWRWAPLIVELGLGGGVFWKTDPPSCGDMPGQTLAQHDACLRVSGFSRGLIPDLIMGLGLEI